MRITEIAFWLLALCWGVYAFWPASWWFRPELLIVTDHQVGENFEVRFTGGAVREFRGSYHVVMRRAADNSIVSEGDGGPFPYRLDAKRPSPMRIDWWAGTNWRAFTNVEPGNYLLVTCWTIHRPVLPILPDKQICIRSNIFKVKLPGSRDIVPPSEGADDAAD